MCMIFALAGPDFALCATDTRWSWSLKDGDQVFDSWHDDTGMKLRRLDHGWATVTGNSRYGILGLRQLERSGVNDVYGALDRALAATREDGTEPGLTHFAIARDDRSLDTISTTMGSRHIPPRHDGRFELVMGCPPSMSADDFADVQAAFAERMGRQTDLPGIIHCVARAFQDAGEIDGRTMLSDEFELGLSMTDGFVGHLRVPVADVGPGYELNFGPPPTIPPFPLLPAERELFGPAAARRTR